MVLSGRPDICTCTIQAHETSRSRPGPALSGPLLPYPIPSSADSTLSQFASPLVHVPLPDRGAVRQEERGAGGRRQHERACRELPRGGGKGGTRGVACVVLGERIRESVCDLTARRQLRRAGDQQGLALSGLRFAQNAVPASSQSSDFRVRLAAAAGLPRQHSRARWTNLCERRPAARERRPWVIPARAMGGAACRSSMENGTSVFGLGRRSAS